MKHLITFLTALLLSSTTFAQTPTPPPGLTICTGEFALCAASTCKPVMNPDGTQKTIQTATGPYPEVVCTCPILNGPAIADTSMGNMKGSCTPTDSKHVWSLFWPRMEYPQQARDFSHNPKDMKVTIQKCDAKLMQGGNASNCFSFNCEKDKNGLAICKCPMGQVKPHTGFLIEAGQGDPSACYDYPVSFPYGPQPSEPAK
jgi:hypothetical protein|tara:strand:- start:1101 stop:1703 length:603 start_codon:yes stop_codon:yes gene_type:complete